MHYPRLKTRLAPDSLRISSNASKPRTRSMFHTGQHGYPYTRHRDDRWVMKTAARPSPVQAVVMSVPPPWLFICSGDDGAIVMAWPTWRSCPEGPIRKNQQTMLAHQTQLKAQGGAHATQAPSCPDRVPGTSSSYSPWQGPKSMNHPPGQRGSPDRFGLWQVGMGPAGPRLRTGSCVHNWRCRYKIARERCQETRMQRRRHESTCQRACQWQARRRDSSPPPRQDQRMPKGKPWRDKACLTSWSLVLQQGDLRLQQFPLQQHLAPQMAERAWSLSPCSALPSMGRVKRRASPAARQGIPPGA